MINAILIQKKVASFNMSSKDMKTSLSLERVYQIEKGKNSREGKI